MRKQLTKIALAAGLTAGLATAAEAQWGGPGYGGYAPGYGAPG
ncbi:MAG TPA: sulfur globule protein, partial [Rhodobacteraceae bacterium]|nr:sulfur globule protein [Paracoccaceae bacterium]